MTVRQISWWAAAIFLAGLMVDLACAQDEGSKPRQIPDFNVMNNDDGDWLCTGPDPAESERNMRNAVDSLVGTGVKTMVQCVAIGSDVLYYPSKAGSNIAWRKGVWESAHLDHSKAFIDAGGDPIRVVGEQSKARGLFFLPSYRMNDHHFASKPDESPLTGEFWMQNRERFTMKNRRLDFSHAEVRQYRMNIIMEVIERYQDIMDGIELDFTRGGSFFPNDEAREKAPLLTEMVAQVRAKLTELEKKQGRTFVLVVRVWPTMNNSKFCGLEVDDWMRRGLVDIVVPAQLYTTAYDMPIFDYAKLAQETGCQVYPCIYERGQFTWPFLQNPTKESYAGPASYRPTPEMMAGAASNFRAMGVQGFEMFNFRVPLGPLGYATQRLLASPAGLAGVNKVYTITQAGGSDSVGRPETYHPPKQIPAEVKAGQAMELKLYIGENFSSPNKTAPSYIGLRLGLREANPNQRIRVSVNGTMVYQGTMAPSFLEATGPAEVNKGFPHVPQAFFQVQLADAKLLKTGENVIVVELADEKGQFQLTEVMVGVLFADPFPKRV